MTTNQTIDGVQRELLEGLSALWPDGADNDGSGRIGWAPHVTKLVKELRTLLDAPAVESELARMTRRCQNAELALKVQTENYEALKATQPQGEPVAKSQWDVASNPVLGYADSYRAMARQGVETVSIWSVITDLERNIAPLYSEPPEPVKVTLQQVLKAYEYAESHPHKYLRGTTNWCAAVAYSINTK